jgi:hypothetical protein
MHKQHAESTATRYFVAKFRFCKDFLQGDVNADTQADVSADVNTDGHADLHAQGRGAQ